MNYNKLLNERITSEYGSQGAFARAVKQTRQSVNGKLTGRANLTRKDVQTWGKLLRIPEAEYRTYFPAYFERCERNMVF